VRSGLVDIVREFLAVYQLTRDVSRRYRRGELQFSQVQTLIGDDEKSCLFRLKERCHALFRHNDPSADAVMRREALFDLAIGSLFHEAMKFRESFYQRVAYGPKVRALRREGEDDALFREFERILEAAAVRIDEALQETEALLAQTRDQLRSLLTEHRESGLVARYLIEHPDAVAAVFDEGLDGLLARIHGNAAEGYARAGESYLESGYFGEARAALEEAIRRGAERPELQRGVHYARGLQAYLAGRYDVLIEELRRWLDAEPSAEEAIQAELALAAVSRVGPQAADGGDPELVRTAAVTAERLQALARRSAPQA
jgi:tetratricopeptide (TPR) repeat protein